jgi:putative spermidine/putrescine transport system ATP-binding protein
MPASSLKISGLAKRYGDFVALAPTELEVAQGEFLTLLGPSGSGKTTLLSLIAGLATPDGGQLWINGHDVTYGAPYERDIGMVFQNYALFPHMTAAENIAFPLKMRKIDTATA